MNNNIDENEQLKLHIEQRKNILLKLQHVYARNLYRRSSDIGNFPSNLPERNEKLESPVIEDLFTEMYGNRFNGNTGCYRCKHFLRIPQNLCGPCEKISDDTEQYEADLNFIQAVVWLKSATTYMKDISIEQYHLAFHKQWANINYARADSDRRDKNALFGIQENIYQSSSSINLLCNDQKDGDHSDTDTEDTNSIYLLRNLQYNGKHGAPRPHNEKHINEGNDIFIKKLNELDTSGSSQSYESVLNSQTSTQNYGTLCNQVIPDSDAECSSCSDMFEDSLGGHESVTSIQNEKEENGLIAEKSIEKFSLISRSISKKPSLETSSDLAVISNAAHSLDIALFNEDSILSTDGCSQLRRQLSPKSGKQIVSSSTKTADSNFHNKNSIVPSLQIVNAASPLKDSAYDTYRLSGERTPMSNCILRNEDISIFPSENIGHVTPYQSGQSINCSRGTEFHRIEMEKDQSFEGNRQTCSFPSFHRSDENDDFKKKYSFVAQSYVENRYSQGDLDLIEDEAYGGSSSKRKKLDSSCESITREQNEMGGERISSEWLKFTLDTLNIDDVALQSVKVILSVLQDERVTKQYMRKRCWRDTLEEQAVDAILNFCDVLEAENRTNVCTQQMSQAVIRMLDRIIGSPELNKVSIFVHQISIILQLCTSMKVCIETINYLTEKLKSYEDILISLINGKKANVHNAISQLHIIFYALTICLQKYRLVFINDGNDQLEEEIIPPIVNLWKKQLKFEGAIVEDSVQTRERRWLMILDNFTVIATENFIQFAEKSRKLVNLLTYVKPLNF